MAPPRRPTPTARIRIAARGSVVAGLLALLMPLTTTAAQPGPAALAPHVMREIAIAGRAGVPADAAGVFVNVTSTRSGGAGFVVVSSCTAPQPTTSNLNFAAGVDAAVGVLAPLSPSGSICLVSSAATDIVVDVFGYLPAGSSIEPLARSRRAIDTRNGIGVAAPGKVPAGTSLELDTGAVPGLGEVDGVAVGVVGVGPAAPGFVSAGPCDGPRPTTSTLNLVPGRDIANLALTAVDDEGRVCLTPSVDVHLVVDVMGSVESGASDPVLLARGRRVVDSRLGIGTAARRWSPGETRPVSIAGVAGVAGGAETAFVNLTATRVAAAGFAVLHPCGVVPRGSNLNFVPGVDVANASLVRVAADGTFCLTSSAETDLLVDLVGVSTDPATIVSFDAVRVYDSRAEEREACGLGVVHPAPRELWVVDLAFGGLVESAVFEPFVLGNTSSLPARVTPECDAIVVATNRGSPGTPGLVGVLHADFEGVVTELGEFTAPNSPIFELDLLADGTPVWWDADGVVRRVDDGSAVIDCGGTCGARVDLLEHDVVARAAGSDWEIFGRGDHTATATVPLRGEVSPGRRYQLVADGSEFEVLTFDAARTVVRRDFAGLASGGPSTWSGFWIDDGLVAICLDPLAAGVPTRSFVWNIFADPRELPVAACLTTGR